MLKCGAGIGDHLVILLDLETTSLIGNYSPRIVSVPGRVLRADVHTYKTRYNSVLLRATSEQTQDV